MGTKSLPPLPEPERDFEVPPPEATVPQHQPRSAA